MILNFMNYSNIFAKNNNKIDINYFSPKKRRDMSIAFVPENRLGHSAVPELTLSENKSDLSNKNWVGLKLLKLVIP